MYSFFRGKFLFGSALDTVISDASSVWNVYLPQCRNLGMGWGIPNLLLLLQ